MRSDSIRNSTTGGTCWPAEDRLGGSPRAYNERSRNAPCPNVSAAPLLTPKPKAVHTSKPSVVASSAPHQPSSAGVPGPEAPLGVMIAGLVVLTIAAVALRRCHPRIPAMLLAVLAVAAAGIPLCLAITAAVVLASWNAFADATREEAIRNQARAANDETLKQILEEIKKSNRAVIKGAKETIPDERAGLIAVATRFADQVTAYLSNQLTGLMARRLRELGPRPSGGYSGAAARRSDQILQEVADETVDSFNRNFKPTALDIAERLKYFGARLPEMVVLLSHGHPTGMDEIEDIAVGIDLMAKQLVSGG